MVNEFICDREKDWRRHFIDTVMAYGYPGGYVTDLPYDFKTFMAYFNSQEQKKCYKADQFKPLPSIMLCPSCRQEILHDLFNIAQVSPVLMLLGVFGSGMLVHEVLLNDLGESKARWLGVFFSWWSVALIYGVFMAIAG